MSTRRSFITGAAATAAFAAPVARAAALTNGFDARLLKAVNDAFLASPVNFHGLLVEHHGQIALETYRKGKDQPLGDLTPKVTDFGPDTLHDLRGISKSVVALLWGMAQADGKVPGLDAKVLDLYPKLAKFKRDGRETIAIRHLLNMSAGLKWTEAGAKGDAFGLTWHPDQLAFIFDRPMVATPGKVFTDCSGCTAILADLLQDRVGMSLVDYARTRLFGPLGIDTFEWRKDVLGRIQSFSGLRLKPRDLVHIGRMVMWGGQWQGLALIPADMIAASIQPLINTGVPQIAPQYGFGWWSGPGQALGHPMRWQAAVGEGGNRLFMAPQLDLIVVTTAGDYETAIDEAPQRLFERIVGATRA